jgi:hypothetical protein
MRQDIRCAATDISVKTKGCQLPLPPPREQVPGGGSPKLFVELELLPGDELSFGHDLGGWSTTHGMAGGRLAIIYFVSTVLTVISY